MSAICSRPVRGRERLYSSKNVRNVRNVGDRRRWLDRLPSPRRSMVEGAVRGRIVGGQLTERAGSGKLLRHSLSGTAVRVIIGQVGKWHRMLSYCSLGSMKCAVWRMPWYASCASMFSVDKITLYSPQAGANWAFQSNV
jgi:hypothetical protein